MNNKDFVNREISWLSFNQRVLQEAMDPSVPLLERLRFLGIFSSNLDEFYRVRVANVQREIDYISETSLKISKYGYDPSELMLQIQQTILNQRIDFERVFDEIKTELAKNNIHILNEKQLDEAQGNVVRNYFRNTVLRKLVPIILDENGDRFPLLQDNLIYLAVTLSKSKSRKEPKHALIEIPAKLVPRFYVLPKQAGQTHIMLLDDVIRYNLNEIFTIFDYTEFSAYVIKISRDAELDFDDDISKSFLQRISKSLKERKIGRPVRLTFDKEIDPELLHIIMRGLRLKDNKFLMPGGRYHNFKDFMGFPKVGKKSFFYQSHRPMPHPAAPHYRRLFDVLRQKDLLLHYPYQSFDYTIELLREAAIDPYVTEIKMTVYRVAAQSSLVNALLNAQKNGKAVTVVVEFQARFDEEANIKLANRLSDEGIKVIQGVQGLKVHCKLIYIKRIRKKSIERYGIIGTGNFHEKTAHVYSDTALFTSNRKILKEVEHLFEFFNTNYKNYQYQHLLVAPFKMREVFCSLIDHEIQHAQNRKKAYIYLKMNSLVDEAMIEKLYEASQAGVKIRLIIRGICRLKPGVEGLSDNIEAISIVDKYLEHSRIMIFANGGDEKYFIASADWMERNLNRRIEVGTPIFDPDLKAELRDFFNIQWRDNCKARIIDPEQQNNYRPKAQRRYQSQLVLEKYFLKKLKQ
ncbi:polyphosphate kinase 1 [bacterium]|nr:polyphosphate kinase 1 [bacterium]